MNWLKFKNYFHPSWHKKIKPFIESKECDEIYKFLKTESGKGKKIAPLSFNLWKAFYETSLDDLKCVILGTHPYNTFKNDIPIADGLLMGGSILEKVELDLQEFYNALERDLYNGINLHYIKNPDVSYLANRGVLMLNASLTIEKNSNNSHMYIWKPFIIYLFKNVFNDLDVPFIYLGKEIEKYKEFRSSFSYNFILEHPKEAAIKHIDWEPKKVFSKIDKILEKNNGITKGIQWLDIPNEVPY